MGEAFDKVSRAIGLGYPGGPQIQKAAEKGNPEAIHFPRPCLEEEGYSFSFSGLKTAVLNYINTEKQAGREINRADVAASFQEAVTDVLCEHTIEAAKQNNSKIITIAGGVASNSRLREKMTEMAGKENISVLYPPPVLCTDNAAMIACAGYFAYENGERAGLNLNAIPSLQL